MTESDKVRDEGVSLGVNRAYAHNQLARAFTTASTHGDPDTRERARSRVARWEAVVRGLREGSVAYGSRTPLSGVPAWATLDVVTGGFATGEMLAGGPFSAHERARIELLPAETRGNERHALNTYFLSEAGFTELRERLHSGHYEVELPEEAALLVITWLADRGHSEQALELADTLSPWFGKLRFYPVPTEHARPVGARMHVQTAGKTQQDLRDVGEQPGILAQKEAVEIWAPLYDRLVALLLETIEQEQPFRRIPPGWRVRASALLEEYRTLRKKHQRCGKPDRAKHPFFRLRALLAKCLEDVAGLANGEVNQARHMLEQYIRKHGRPESEAHSARRRRQRDDVSGPSFSDIADIVAERLNSHPASEGVENIDPLLEAVSPEESKRTGVPDGTALPDSIRRKVSRCLHEAASVLLERGLITSGEAFAHVLPQMTSGLRAEGMADAALSRLYAATYRAFRRRRSLLLLDLQKQVQLEELPWVAAMERFRSQDLSTRELNRKALEEASALTLAAFPHAILPNKLLQEMRALAAGAELDLPLVDELAADIFVGRFSGKFIISAVCAAEHLEGTLYATYYDIDCSQVRQWAAPIEKQARTWFWRAEGSKTDRLAELCALRAGVPLGSWSTAINGMLIEQQQILTTQNLAVLFATLDLRSVLDGQLVAMARRCFAWICQRQQVKVTDSHSRLIAIKNSAYAWRQMIFFLAELPKAELPAFVNWAHAHLEEQQPAFQCRFRPALTGLERAMEGRSPENQQGSAPPARRFLGWSHGPHWLMSDD